MARKVIGLAKNAVGRRGSTRRRWALLLSLVFTVGTAVYMQADSAIFVPFELDRNTVDASSGPNSSGDDWDLIYQDHINTATSNADAFAFIADNGGGTADLTIFTGGGSKDDLDIPGWNHTSGSPPDKDELLNGYAARYGDVLYFGADRYAGNGSAQMGIWFFQNDIGPDPANLGRFTGEHKDGDVLILSDFTNGGAETTIRVFRWNGVDDDDSPADGVPDCTAAEQADHECFPGVGAINGTLDLIGGTDAQTADCVGPPSVPTNHPFCATVNDVAINVAWPFVPKGAKGNGPFMVPDGQFYEGGIDLAAPQFGGLNERCFASFLIETRSSPSVDAVLKDFLGGGFEECTSTVATNPVANGTSTTPVAQILLGQSVYDYALVTGAGASDPPTGTMTFFVCQPTQLTPPTTGVCTTGGSPVPAGGGTVNLSPIMGSDPPASQAWSAAYTPTVLGRHCFRGVYSGDSTYPGATDASANECFTVISIPATIGTAQTWSVIDTATISVGPTGTVLTGTVTFELFTNATCTGTAAWTSGPHSVTGQTSPVSFSTPTAYTVSTTPGTYPLSWRVIFDSTNPAHRDVTHACVETASLTYANGGTTTSP